MTERDRAVQYTSKLLTSDKITITRPNPNDDRFETRVEVGMTMGESFAHSLLGRAIARRRERRALRG